MNNKFLRRGIICGCCLLVLIGCSEDMDSDIDPDDMTNIVPPTTQELLLGRWMAVSFSVEVTSMSTINDEVINSTISIEGVDLDYGVNFMESNYTTMGEYSYTITGEVGDMDLPSTSERLIDIEGVGEYVIMGDTLLIEGQFFTYKLDGMDISAEGGEGLVIVEITDNDDLIIRQDETVDNSTGNVIAMSRIQSISTWRRL